MAKYNGYKKEKKDYMMASLCVDLKNPKTGKIEPFVLLKTDLEAILRYTTYNENANKLLDSFTYETVKLINDNLEGPIDKNTFYILKKNKVNKNNFETTKFVALYKNNEDVFFVQPKEIINILRNNYSFNQESFNGEGFFKPNSIDLFNLIASLITDTRTRRQILNNYYESGIGKNISDNLSLGQMIGILDKNIKVAVEYICENPYKKLKLCSKLRKAYGKKLYTFNKSADESEYKSKTIRRIMANKQFKYENLRSEVEKKVKSFFEPEKEEKKVFEPYIYEGPIDEREEQLKQKINEASSPEAKCYAVNKLAKYYLMLEYKNNPEKLDEFSDLDDIEKIKEDK